MAIKYTPSKLIIWVANKVLKDIAELTAFNFDVEKREIVVNTKLYGEESSIDVLVQDFAIYHDGESYQFIIYHATTNKPWLNTIFSHIIGKAWKVPVPPQFTKQFDLIAELFAARPLVLENLEKV